MTEPPERVRTAADLDAIIKYWATYRATYHSPETPDLTKEFVEQETAEALSLRDNRSWFNETRGWLDVLRCRVGRHRRITQAMCGGRLVSRCSCGGVELDEDGLWIETNQVGRRP